MGFKWFVLPSVYTDLSPELKRIMQHGWGNGYVAIPEGHPFYGKDFYYINKFVDVHGDLSFSQYSFEWTEVLVRFNIDLGDGNYWIIGFDTGHVYIDGPHHDKEWVEQETLRLLEQVKAITHSMDDFIKEL